MALNAVLSANFWHFYRKSGSPKSDVRIITGSRNLAHSRVPSQTNSLVTTQGKIAKTEKPNNIQHNIKSISDAAHDNFLL